MPASVMALRTQLADSAPRLIATTWWASSSTCSRSSPPTSGWTSWREVQKHTMHRMLDQRT